MLKPSEAGFRRLIPLLRPHRRLLTIGTLCMLVFVSSQLVLMRLMGRLLPDVGSGDLQRILLLAASVAWLISLIGASVMVSTERCQESQRIGKPAWRGH